MAEAGLTLEYTPTWVVAVVCTVIVLLSFIAERSLHYAGKQLKKRNQKPLFEALLKIKEELMLLGFISLLLAVFQDRIGRICISEKLSSILLPCKKGDSSSSTNHFMTFFTVGTGRRLLADDASSSTSPTQYCAAKGKVPLLSTIALHHLHIFIFVLAVVHVIFCALTLLLGGIKIRMWKKWEDEIQKRDHNAEEVLQLQVTAVQDITFIKDRSLGIGKDSSILGWMHAFFKQFHGSVTKADYATLRLGFIMTHCRSNPKFNFHNYMVRALEADFKKVVGISWYLWLFVVAFLLLNVAGWHAYFWIAFIPLIVSFCQLLLAVGTKLEHVITQLALEVAQRHVAIQGALVVQPSDDHFWFHKPRLVLLLIHIILFQNSFELAFFFFILVQYKWHSCIMGQASFIIPRLVIGIFIQFLCCFSTLPLYAIVTQMGSSFKKAIFEEHIQQGLVGWAQKAKRNKHMKTTGGSTQSGYANGDPSTTSLELSSRAGTKDSEIEDVESQSTHPTSPIGETRKLMGS